MIIKYSVIIFLTQIVFIGTRTWNVRAISKNNLKQVLISGAIIHTCWLINISIGSISMHKIMTDFSLKYLPIILCSLIGSSIGSWLGLIEKQKK